MANFLRTPLLGVAGVLGVMAITFQNCSKVSFNANQVSSSAFESTTQIQINNGAKYTNTTAVEVELSVPTAIDVYLTNDPTCATGGTWQQMVPKIAWSLAQTNATATVYAKFHANGGADLPCVNTSIVHDDQPPTVAFTKFPTGFSKNLIEPIGLSGTDAVSGIDHFECRVTGQSAFSTCSDSPQASGALDGPFSFQFRAVDKAGNYSQPTEKDWVFDHTPPVVKITSAPSNPSMLDVAQFAFSASDGPVGSGVDHLMCSIDGNPPAVCGLSVTYSNPLLMNGNHTFSVYGIDVTGNQSQPVTYNWVVNYPPSGNFTILGVTGPSGNVSNSSIYLGGSLMPTVFWSASTGASYYNVTISPTGKTTPVCSAPHITIVNGMPPSQAFGQNCTLVDGGRYDIEVTAFTENGTTTLAPLFTFAVDNSAPTVAFGTVNISGDQKTVIVPFTITDGVSGVQSATCTVTNTKYSTTQTYACTGLTSLTLTNLVDGPYVFTISATDKAGNTGSASEPFDTNLIICDPFVLVDGGCVTGLQANLYYLTPTQIVNPTPLVDYILTNGVKADATVYLSRIFVPTRAFTNGFNASDNTFVTDNSGQKLTSWFALDIQTVFKLGPDDAPGYYELGTITDDGSILQTMVNGVWTDYIAADGYGSSKFVCDTKGMYLDATSRIQLRIKYFQGPPNEIALVLLMRKLPGAPTATNLADTECGLIPTGTAGPGGAYWFGPNLDDFTSTKNHYGQLLSRGWYSPTTANFELNQVAPGH